MAGEDLDVLAVHDQLWAQSRCAGRSHDLCHWSYLTIFGCPLCLSGYLSSEVGGSQI